MKFYLQLEDVNSSYVGGEIISGRVVLDLPADEQATGLIVRCVGSAEVHFAESQHDSKGKHKNLLRRILHRHGATEEVPPAVVKHSTAQETYFEYKAFLLGQPDSAEFTITAGPKAFPFNFDLPVGIPSSFQGHHGGVQYFIEARLKRPPLQFDYETKTIFNVTGILDLNNYPDCADSADTREEKNKCCLCCKSGPLGFSLKLARSGYLVGDRLEFTANMYNMSSKDLQAASVEIVQVTSFHAGAGRTSTEKTVVFEKSGPGLEPGETKIWEENDIIIPHVPPTKLGGCELIGLEYEVKLIMAIPKFINLSGQIPIVIGTTPFQNYLIGPVSPGSSKGSPNSAAMTMDNSVLGLAFH